jgi:integrase
MIVVEKFVDPRTGEKFSCVFDTQPCLPVEPIQRFLNYCRHRGLAPNTVTTYAYRLLAFWQWCELKSLNWAAVSLNGLADFTNWYLLGGEIDVICEGVREAASRRSARTVNQALTVIQEFYEFHYSEGRVDAKQFTRLVHGRGKRGGFLKDIVKSTPGQVKRIKLKESKVFPGCLTDDQIVRLVESCTTYRDRLILMLLRETGIRRGEVLGLHLADVQDLDVTGRIHIRRRSNPNSAWAKGSERTIPILRNLRDIRNMLQFYLLEEYSVEAEQLGHGLLFTNLEGKCIGQPMSLSRLNKLLQQLYARTGIKANPHLFRHTFATRMLQEKYPDYYVQQLLGHRSITTTKDVYNHVLDEINLCELLDLDGNEVELDN